MLEYELAFLTMVSSSLSRCPTARSVKPSCTVSSLSFGRDRCSEAFHRFIVEYAHWAGESHPNGGAKALSRRAAIFVRALERAGELDQTRDVVHRQELVHVR